MFKIETRYQCPVCLGASLHKVAIDEAQTLILDLCKRCGGIWFDSGEIKKLRTFRPKKFFSKIEPSKETLRMQCHACHCFMDRNAEKCVKCEWENIIDCPVCLKPMKRTKIMDLCLDYCETCKGVWFDNMELSQIWNRKIKTNFQKALDDSKKTSFIDNDAVSLFIDVLEFDPGLIYYGGKAAVEIGEDAVLGACDMISNSPEIAGSIFEGAGEIAGSIFETIAEIVGGLFDL